MPKNDWPTHFYARKTQQSIYFTTSILVVSKRRNSRLEPFQTVDLIFYLRHSRHCHYCLPQITIKIIFTFAYHECLQKLSTICRQQLHQAAPPCSTLVSIICRKINSSCLSISAAAATAAIYFLIRVPFFITVQSLPSPCPWWQSSGVIIILNDRGRVLVRIPQSTIPNPKGDAQYGSCPNRFYLFGRLDLGP